MNNQHITVKRLESRKWHCTVTTDGVVQTLSGCTLTFTVKASYTKTDGEVLFQLTATQGGISFTDTTGGKFDLVIHSTATESVTKSGKNEVYKFDHRIQLPSGAIKVLEQGDFVVEPNVTDTMA